MRTTLNIEDALLQRLKVVAADSGQTVSQVTEEAVRAYLSPRQEVHSKPIKIAVSRHDLELRPGVNLDSNTSIAEAMDEEYVEKMRATARR
jgi:plasmid stability protein